MHCDPYSKLDASIVGKHIYMRWKDYGWQLGKYWARSTSRSPAPTCACSIGLRPWADTAYTYGRVLRTSGVKNFGLPLRPAG